MNIKEEFHKRTTVNDPISTFNMLLSHFKEVGFDIKISDDAKKEIVIKTNYYADAVNFGFWKAYSNLIMLKVAVENNKTIVTLSFILSFFVLNPGKVVKPDEVVRRVFDNVQWTYL